jgi:hypothetical protein
MVVCSTWAMFLPLNYIKSSLAVKEIVSLVLFLPLLVIGYFASEAILNPLLGISTHLFFDSVMRTQMLEGRLSDYSDLRAACMMFIMLGCALTFACNMLMVQLPKMADKLLDMASPEDGVDGALSSMKSKTESGGVSITQAKSAVRDVGNDNTVKSNAGDSRNDANKNTIVSEGNTNNVGRQPADIRAKEDLEL